MNKIVIDDLQLQKLLSAIKASGDVLSWSHLINTALPVFLAALLGLLTGIFLDWLKTRREDHSSTLDRRKSELSLLSRMITATVFNIEAMIHMVMQQIIPHFNESYAAVDTLARLRDSTIDIPTFSRLLHEQHEPMVMRCPDIHLEDLNLSQHTPFILKEHPDIIKLSGWAITYSIHLNSILAERNRMINNATADNTANLDIHAIETMIGNQCAIGNAEIVNALQYLVQLKRICDELVSIASQEYRDVDGPKFKVILPPAFDEALSALKLCMKQYVSTLPAASRSAYDILM